MAPALIRKVSLNGGGYDPRLAVGGDYLYLVQEDGGLQILSIHDPLQPTLVGHVLFPGEELDVAVADHLALVIARGEDRPDYLHLIDITNPTHPTLVASHRLIMPGDSLSVEGHIAYVDPLPLSGLRSQIIDFSDPANPRTLPWWTSRSIPGGVIPGRDGIGYRPSANGIEVLDIRDPGNPRHVGGNTSFSPLGMTLDEKHL